jgi:TolA-binding protein
VTCLAISELAAAAVEPATDARIIDHLATCRQCRAELDEQRAVRDLARRTPVVALTGARRAALGAEIAARADADADGDLGTGVAADRAKRPRRAIAIGLAVAAVAAAAVIALVVTTREQPNAGVTADTDTSETSASGHGRAMSDPRTASGQLGSSSGQLGSASDARTASGQLGSASTASASDSRTASGQAGSADKVSGSRSDARVVGASTTMFARDTTARRDLVTLREGKLAIDAMRARPVQVVAGTTRVVIAGARASVLARNGVIDSVTVFAGSVEVSVGDRRRVIAAGVVWERDAGDALPGDKPPTDEAPLRAFREGWTALRAGKHADAIAAFDRAVALDRAPDPIVAEDAAYWAAVTSERLGNRADAAKRFKDFLARFPHSPRAAGAKAALARP